MKRRIFTALAMMLIAVTGIIHADDADLPKTTNDKGEEVVDWEKVKSPVAYTEKSIKRGQMWYMRECTGCHGPDGKAQIDIIADATDLTNTKRWHSGSTEGEVFRSIRDGAGVAMPPYKSKIKKEEDIWHLVNFVRSLWPKDQRPELVEEEPSEPAEGEDNE